MKRLQAFVAALAVTVLIGLGIFAVSNDAVAQANQNSAAAALVTSNVPSETSGVSTNVNLDQAQTQIAQLKTLIAQYQQREKQYQSQLSDSTQQVQNLQNVMVELQNRGVIRILNDGTIQLRRGN